MKNLEITNKWANILLGLSFLFSLFMHRKIMELDIQGAHAWRQTQTMWNIRNFIRHDGNILNPRVSYFNGGKENILRYEFPIMQYCIAQVLRLLGEKILTVRICMFLIFCLTSFGFFYLVRDIFESNLVAICGTYFLQLSPLFYYYAFNPLPDNLALCGTIWYLYFILKYRRNKTLNFAFLAGFSLLIATLAKLPYLMYAIVSIFFFTKKIIIQKQLSKKNFLSAFVQFSMLIPALLWYSWVMPAWEGNSVLGGIFQNALPWSEYKEILHYHRIVILNRLLLYAPVWLFMLIGVFVFWKKVAGRKWMLSLIGICLLFWVLELNAINVIHDYYMMPFLPCFYILISAGILFLIRHQVRYLSFLVLIAVIWAPFDTYESTYGKWGMDHDGFNANIYANKQVLKEAVPSHELCIILNDRSQSIFSYNVDNMGHIFYNDEMPVEWIGDMIDNYGITHMYSDSRKIDKDPAFSKFVDTLLLDIGGVHVYKLRDPKTDTIKYLPEFKKVK